MDCPVVILCGGKGMRLREETEFRPKPLVEIGGKPILWHIMKSYAHQGYKNFILCLGYKGDMIKDYFLNYSKYSSDFTLNLKNGSTLYHNNENNEDWNIIFAETGMENLTGKRIKMIEKYINGDTFFCTYGDGVADVDLNKLLDHHVKSNKIATITGVKQPSKYGFVDVDADFSIKRFEEKPVVNSYINGGFFAFDKKIFDYIGNENVMLERAPFDRLVSDRQMSLYFHEGFWHSLDTYKDMEDLNTLWKEGGAEWKKWN